MLVVSFDIGMINLGCSVLLDNKLIVWKVISLFEKMKKSITIAEISQMIYIRMDELVGDIKEHTDEKIDYVLLENQPSKGVMKTIQILIYGYFFNLKHYDNYVKDIVQVSASLKLEGYEMDKTCSKSEQYRNNKKKAIEICSEMIKGNERLENIFNIYKKKADDLCDSLLQIKGYLKKRKDINIIVE
jgi:hypothetical protein|tara:strand:+ start:1889 stop:2449 length:561 start_codon:yes stop_codon:yes gene_type:complete